MCSCERGREREKVCGVYVCVRVREGERGSLHTYIAKCS